MADLLSSLPPWLQLGLAVVWALGPVFTLGAAALAAWIAWRSLQQRQRADRHAEWWRRIQWAVEKAMAGDVTEATVAVDVLSAAHGSGLTTDEDLDLLHSITDVILDRVTRDQFEDPGGDIGSKHPGRNWRWLKWLPFATEQTDE